MARYRNLHAPIKYKDIETASGYAEILEFLELDTSENKSEIPEQIAPENADTKPNIIAPEETDTKPNTFAPEETDTKQNTSGHLFVKEFSPLRANAISWLNIVKGSNVLEINSGCGAVTEYLLGMDCNVRCIEPSMVKCKINALRNADAENLDIYVGDATEFFALNKNNNTDTKTDNRFGDISYGYIIIWDAHELVDKIDLNMLAAMLNKTGKLVLAFNNKYGLKYFAGCKDEGMDYFSSIDKASKLITKEQFESVLAAQNIEHFDVYYPYPDYVFTHSVYSDYYLPKAGDLTNNDYYYGDERLIIFDETEAYNNIIKDGKFAEFSNSYMYVVEGAHNG